jgi:dephospho-CoA kinase
MARVGLTGGIGSGKSTVAQLLVARGAALVDADLVSRAIVEPGQPAYDAVVVRFGRRMVGPTGGLDRAALAAEVFSDPSALADLNRITHPAIEDGVEDQATALEASGARIVVIDLPLLDQSLIARHALREVIVVDTPEEVAVARLVEGRGFGEADARARIAAQISRDRRRQLADFVIDNSGDRDRLEEQVDLAWSWLVRRLQPGPARPPA